MATGPARAPNGGEPSADPSARPQAGLRLYPGHFAAACIGSMRRLRMMRMERMASSFEAIG